MKRASHFTISPTWGVLLKDMGIDPIELLKHAELPTSLFGGSTGQLTPSEYFRLWHSLDALSGEHEVALLLAEHLSTEAFDPPLLASLSSRNLNQALQRIQQYKPLIGPLGLNLDINDDHTKLEVRCYAMQENMPAALAATELVFFTALARLATRHRVEPRYVSLPSVPENTEALEDYFGCSIEEAREIAVHFDYEDATRPFLTSNDAMWDFLEVGLKQRLLEIGNLKQETSARVKASLLESLPAGVCSIEAVASELAMSKRTLQRKLSEEETSFQNLLSETRAELADRYLKKSALSLAEISFLLGFQETNSFIRAYSQWRGVSPGQVRA
jgi:AraC-like DNA-binding protein